MWVNIPRSTCIIKIQILHIRIFQMNTSEWHLKCMSSLLVSYSLVLLGRVGKGIVVRNRLNTFEFRIEGIQCWFRADGGFDVCLLRHKIFNIDRVSDTQWSGADREGCRGGKGKCCRCRAECRYYSEWRELHGWCYWQSSIGELDFMERWCFAAAMKQAWPEVGGDGKDSCVSTSFWSMFSLGCK